MIDISPTVKARHIYERIDEIFKEIRDNFIEADRNVNLFELVRHGKSLYLGKDKIAVHHASDRCHKIKPDTIRLGLAKNNWGELLRLRNQMRECFDDDEDLIIRYYSPDYEQNTDTDMCLLNIELTGVCLTNRSVVTMDQIATMFNYD